MEIFDKQFVYFMWDDVLKDKEVIAADTISDIRNFVNSGKVELIKVKPRNDAEFPFGEDGGTYCYDNAHTFVYYDPNYKLKIAFYKEHKKIEVFDEVVQNWIITENPKWYKNKQYRIKSEKPVKWWVVPKSSVWENKINDVKEYTIEPQQDYYSKSRPPLKSNFATKEDAQKWLDDYLVKEIKFRVFRERLDKFNECIQITYNKIRGEKPVEKEYLLFKIDELVNDINLKFSQSEFDCLWDKSENKDGD